MFILACLVILLNWIRGLTRPTIVASDYFHLLPSLRRQCFARRLSVFLSVSRITQKLLTNLMRFISRVRHMTSKNWLVISDDLNHVMLGVVVGYRCLPIGLCSVNGVGIFAVFCWVLCHSLTDLSVFLLVRELKETARMYLMLEQQIAIESVVLCMI